MAMEGPAAAGAVTQIVGRLGHIEPFDESASDWSSYEERLSSFLQVNRIPEDDKQDMEDGQPIATSAAGWRLVTGQEKVLSAYRRRADVRTNESAGHIQLKSRRR
ncbi:uncharacterized protein LOC142566715 [Dermacentor variabilis]|uniref:uncharacterized protein LOC142566715 n=1 Tax=Dermacentor variabilis TaxID=34621 RepID=UPI003F5C912B